MTRPSLALIPAISVSIWARNSSASSAEAGPLAKLAVQDTGKGILPENLSKIFEPLYTTKSKGIGLGLPVSKSLVEANGGEITVTSRPGAGSTFTILLPCVKRSEN